MSKLLTPELNELLYPTPVVRSLAMPGREDLKVGEVTPGQLVTSADIRTKSHVLIEEDLGDERLTIVDKAEPHAHFDAMILSSGEEQKPGLSAHSDKFIGRSLEYAADFAQFAKANGFYPVVAWSYDPLTDDRPSGQGEKRFHAHLMARTADEVELILSTPDVIGALDQKSRRRIAEESSTLGGLVLSDLLGEEVFKVLEPVKPFDTIPSALSLQMTIPGGWGSLTTAGFIDDFKRINRAIHDYDRLIREAIYEDTPQAHWLRPEVRADYHLRTEMLVDNMGIQSSFARSALSHYLKNMQRGLITDIQNARANYSKSDIVHLYPLRSVSYTTCITEIDGLPRIHFRVNLFTDLGGAGVAMVGGIPVKVKKGIGVMSDDDIKKRRNLQDQFLENVRS